MSSGLTSDETLILLQEEPTLIDDPNYTGNTIRSIAMTAIAHVIRRDLNENWYAVLREHLQQ